MQLSVSMSVIGSLICNQNDKLRHIDDSIRQECNKCGILGQLRHFTCMHCKNQIVVLANYLVITVA